MKSIRGMMKKEAAEMDEEVSARRFRLTVAYDGRPFEGWQSQVGGNTIQDKLLAALQEIAPAITTVQGSGRTDAGVSAEGQVAHFDAPAGSSMNAAAWLRALNTKLPPTIRVMDCDGVPNDFHARFSAVGKTYRYQIWTGPVLPPLKAGLVWHLPRFENDDVGEFRTALKCFEGRHDFRAFSANRGDGKDQDRDSVRTVTEVASTWEGELMSVTFSGEGFLYKMVRFLVGSAAWAARGKLKIEEIERLLEAPPENGKAPFCAPADGLSLVKVRYPR